MDFGQAASNSSVGSSPHSSECASPVLEVTGHRHPVVPALKMPVKGAPSSGRETELPTPPYGRGGLAAQDEDEDDYTEASAEEHSFELEGEMGRRQGSEDLWDGALSAAARVGGGRNVVSEEGGDGRSRPSRPGPADTDSTDAIARQRLFETGSSAASLDGVNERRSSRTEQAAGHTSSAPAFRDNRSDTSVLMEQRYEGMGDRDMEVPMSANSWHETLARFPALLQLYPLADSSEWEAPPDGDGEGDEHANGIEAVQEEEEAKAEQSTSAPPAQPEKQGATCQAVASREEALPQQAREVDAPETVERQTPVVVYPIGHEERYQDCWPEGVANGGATWPGPSPPHTPSTRGHGQVTPHSVSSRAGASAWNRSRYPAGAHPSDRGWTNGDLGVAWVEVDQVRRSLEAREREVAKREAALRRGEARNDAAARQLAELRHRLDDYSAELEQGVMSLTAQQDRLREERQQTLEMQARVRRMCAAAVRDDVVASKARDWDRVWTPTRTMNGY